jgi:nitrate reductase NapE component
MPESSGTLFKTMPRPIRLEWISILYLALFVFAILSPGFVSEGAFGLPEERIEEILIFTFGIVGLVTFSLYERVMEKREKERDQAISDRDQARRELVSTYEYIGGVNRQIDALKKLANETASSLMEEDRVHKHMFKSLAAGAAALVRAQNGAIRIVALDKLRTMREFHLDANDQIRVANKDLLEVHNLNRSHCFIRDENGAEVLAVPSSRQNGRTKAFILLPVASRNMPGIDPGLLNVYANQAEVLYRGLVGGISELQDERAEEAVS